MKIPSDAPAVLTEWCAFRARPRPVSPRTFADLFRKVTDRRGHRLILEGFAHRDVVLDRLQDLYARTTRTPWGGFMPAPDECLARDAVAALIRDEISARADRLRANGKQALAETLMQVPLQFIDPYTFDSLPEDGTLADAVGRLDDPYVPSGDPVLQTLVMAFLYAFERGPTRHVLGLAMGDTADHARAYALYLSGYYYALDWDGIMIACVHDWDLPGFMHPPDRGGSRQA